MPSYEDFQRDYWAPDREAVLAKMQPALPGTPGGYAPLPSSPGGGFGYKLPEVPGGYQPPNDFSYKVPPLGPGSFATAPSPGAPTPAPSPTDPRSVLSGIYGQYGLNPNNPTGLANPLANVDYFLRRMQETGGWQGGNIDYWKQRLAKEIGLAQQGLGNRQEGGGAPGGPAIPHGGIVGQPGASFSLSATRGGGGGGDLEAALRNQLLQQMAQGNQPIDENALGIRQPFEAASLAAQREQDRERTALAERLYAQGGLRGPELAQGIQQSAERNAVGLASIKSGLIGNEIAARRTQLAQALQLANSIGARKEALALQAQLAELDNKFRYAQLGQQGSQFGQELGYRYAGLSQAQNQFNDQYGLQRQAMINQMNLAPFREF